jgi:hypothetical protein
VESDLMESFELFSKRNKDFQVDVFEYEVVPEKLRNQVYFIWKYALGIEYAKTHSGTLVNQLFDIIRDTILREHGLSELYATHLVSANDCELYLRHGRDNEIVLDMIELSTSLIPVLWEKIGWQNISYYKLTMNDEQAVEDLNKRFRENGMGYEFAGGILLRKDSQLLHEEVTKPALHLLQAEGFDGALEEFLKAHDHYRKGNYGDSILNAGKAFESAMKTIGVKESWGLSGKENASNLIALLISKQVIPGYLQNTLIGLATLRNTLAGHGQGAAPIAVPEHFVNYSLHLCGTNIVMLIEAYKAYKKNLPSTV